jgi:uncharacterized caspase-like protein
VALVIGNSSYQHAGELKNPRNDATDMKAALEKLGFEVIVGFNLDKRGMESTIRRFVRVLPDADVGLFFYAGHGMQVSGVNYLLPTDAKLEDAAALDFELVRLDLVQRAMEREAKANILFLDACRDNPLARNLARSMGTRSGSVERGLAPAESGVGTLISYSTQPGNVALDGDGRNSPFTGALVEHLLTSRDDLSNMLIEVRKSVMSATGGRQVPWEHSALTAKLFLSPVEGATLAGRDPSRDQALEAESTFWTTVSKSGNAALIQAYIDRYPDGTFSPLARVLLNELRQKTEAQTAAGKEINRALARELQRELKRVGCDPGDVDGTWDDKARAALENFMVRTRLALHHDAPTQAALDAVKSQLVRVCPPPQQESSPAARKAEPMQRTTGNCRYESREECRTRLGIVSGGGGGGAGRGLGRCAPEHRRMICN